MRTRSARERWASLFLACQASINKGKKRNKGLKESNEGRNKAGSNEEREMRPAKPGAGTYCAFWPRSLWVSFITRT